MWGYKGGAREAQKAGARHSFITEMVIFTLETDYSCKTGYPFDNSRQMLENGCGFNFE